MRALASVSSRCAPPTSCSARTSGAPAGSPPTGPSWPRRRRRPRRKDGWFHELRGAGSCLGHAGRHDRPWPGQSQPALPTLPTSVASHPAPSIHASHEADHLAVSVDTETIQPGTGRVRLTFAPDGGEVRVPAGTTVFDGASSNGIAIDSTCGGHGTCKKCKVRVLGGELPIDTLDPRAFAPDELRDGWRLACRAI